MAGTGTMDLVNQIASKVSIQPGTNNSGLSSDTNGDWVEARDVVGPVHASCTLGAITGSPTATSVNFEMEEADDSSGTNSQKVSNQDEVTLTAAKQHGMLRGHATKPFVRVIVQADDSSFTAGSSPAVDLGATVQYQQNRP